MPRGLDREEIRVRFFQDGVVESSTDGVALVNLVACSSLADWPAEVRFVTEPSPRGGDAIGQEGDDEGGVEECMAHDTLECKPRAGNFSEGHGEGTHQQRGDDVANEGGGENGSGDIGINPSVV